MVIIFGVPGIVLMSERQLAAGENSLLHTWARHIVEKKGDYFPPGNFAKGSKHPIFRPTIDN